MNDNYKTDLQVNKKIKKKIRSIWSIPITSTIVSFIGYLIVAGIVQSTNGISVNYKVSGVEKGWLSSHPLLANSYPKTIKSSITLPSPKIDGYVFDGWFTNKISQSVQKDNKININDGMIDRLFTYQLDVYAKFSPKEYTIALILGEGASLDDLVNHGYDKHSYSTNILNISSTSYYCYDDVFRLPTASKPGKTFNPAGWKINETDTYIQEINPAECLNLVLVAEWL